MNNYTEMPMSTEFSWNYVFIGHLLHEYNMWPLPLMAKQVWETLN